LNNKFPDSKILGVPVSRRIHILVYMVSRDKVDRNTFHKGIQYALEKLGKSNLALKEQQYKFWKQKTRGLWPGKEIVDYSIALCLGADQKTRGLWERDWAEEASKKRRQ